jgi:hypothetical protein
MNLILDPAIKTAVITVGLQVICFVIGYCFWLIRQKITKKDLLYHKKELTEGMIKDKEIEIERSWLLLNEAEDKKEEILKKIEDNEKEIEVEKGKTPMDLDKVKNLRIDNEFLGFAGRYGKDGKPGYVSYLPGKERRNTAIGTIENEIEHHRMEIKKSVMEREYIKVLLKAILKLIKKGVVKDFAKMEKELVEKGFSE